MTTQARAGVTQGCAVAMSAAAVVTCEPESAVFARYEDICEESARASGGDPWNALRVPAMLVAAVADPRMVRGIGVNPA